jgi:long-chain acyl-CoA synthetase
MTAFTNDPRLTALNDMTTRLTGPGQRFELVEEEVRGEPMEVFVNRPRSLRDVLVSGAERGNEDCYIFSDGRRLSFLDVKHQAASVAAALKTTYGIGPGDSIAVCAANCPEWLQLFWAAASAGAVIVAMNGWWTGTEMENALSLTKPNLLVMDEKRWARLEADPGIPILAIEQDLPGLLREQSRPLPTVAIDEDDPFFVVFTSGTTGRPKAAVLSHRSVVGYLELQTFIGTRGATLAGRVPSAAPRRLAPLPMFHVSGITAAVSTMMGAGTTVWPLGRFDPEATLQLISRERVGVWLGAVPHMMRMLTSPAIESIDPSSVLSIGVGGSATTPSFIRLAGSRFPHLSGTFSTGYGSTETGGIVSWAPGWMLQGARDCVGPPLPTIETRITNDAGDVLPDGTEGNIEARSPIIMEGYLGGEEANKETVRPGLWIRTGDYGRIENGLLYIASRLRDLIIRGGENVYPFEIENRLEEHPDIKEAAVVGVENDVFGQEVAAFVVVKAGSPVDEPTLQAWCAQVLASYKVPQQIGIRTEPLPRNAAGKILKRDLVENHAPEFIED